MQPYFCVKSTENLELNLYSSIVFSSCYRWIVEFTLVQWCNRFQTHVNDILVTKNLICFLSQINHSHFMFYDWCKIVLFLFVWNSTAKHAFCGYWECYVNHVMWLEKVNILHCFLYILYTIYLNPPVFLLSIWNRTRPEVY